MSIQETLKYLRSFKYQIPLIVQKSHFSDALDKLEQELSKQEEVEPECTCPNNHQCGFHNKEGCDLFNS